GPADPFTGRAHRRLGVHTAVLCLEARPRQRHDRHTGWGGLGRAVLRVPELHGLPGAAPAVLDAVPATAGDAAAGHGPRCCRAGAPATVARDLRRYRRPGRARPRALLDRRHGVLGYPEAPAVEPREPAGRLGAVAGRRLRPAARVVPGPVLAEDRALISRSVRCGASRPGCAHPHDLQRIQITVAGIV